MIAITDKAIELLKIKASEFLGCDSNKVLVRYEEHSIYYDADRDYYTGLDIGYDKRNGEIAFVLDIVDLTRYKDTATDEEKKLPRCLIGFIPQKGGENMYKWITTDENRILNNINTFFTNLSKPAGHEFFKDITYHVRYLRFSRS